MTADSLPAEPGRVLAVLVAYRPGPELAEGLSAALVQADGVLLWDNSEDPGPTNRLVATLRERAPELPWDRLLRKSPGRNEGLSAAYQAGLDEAAAQQFGSVLLLDQDSQLAGGALEEMRRQFGRLRPQFSVGAVNARNRERVTLELNPKTGLRRLAESHYEGAYRARRLYRDEFVRERLTLIYSGLLLSVPAAKEAGGFAAELFLDAVDYDLGIRLRARGFHLFEAVRAELWHQQGVPTRISWAGRSKLVRGYSPNRTYHLVRDTTVCARRCWRHDRRTAFAILGSMWIGTAGAVALLPERGQRVRAIVAALAGSGRTPPGPSAR
ncbi:MAG: glycosyltransferase [Thermoplasmata archaeon]|nr:glycosyltransferase [Thermoplasmata archaeon]